MRSTATALKTACLLAATFAALALPAAHAQSPSPAAVAAPMQQMDMQSMMKKGNEQMASMKMTGNPDVDFAMMMRVHHQGTIDMAQAELRDGKAAEMKKMAKSIIAAQKKEIAQLDRFLAKNGHPVAAMSK